MWTSIVIVATMFLGSALCEENYESSARPYRDITSNVVHPAEVTPFCITGQQGDEVRVILGAGTPQENTRLNDISIALYVEPVKARKQLHDFIGLSTEELTAELNAAKFSKAQSGALKFTVPFYSALQAASFDRTIRMVPTAPMEAEQLQNTLVEALGRQLDDGNQASEVAQPLLDAMSATQVTTYQPGDELLFNIDSGVVSFSVNGETETVVQEDKADKSLEGALWDMFTDQDSEVTDVKAHFADRAPLLWSGDDAPDTDSDESTWIPVATTVVLAALGVTSGLVVYRQRSTVLLEQELQSQKSRLGAQKVEAPLGIARMGMAARPMGQWRPGQQGMRRTTLLAAHRGGVPEMQAQNDDRPIDGGALRTWSFNQDATMFAGQVQIDLSSEGGPVDADIELWQGPGSVPCKTRVYLEDGSLRPFHGYFLTPGSTTLAVRNIGQLTFPMRADVATDRVLHPSTACLDSGSIIQGGSIRTYQCDPVVQSVQVLLRSEGRPLNARIELLSGPNNVKQVIEVYSEDGSHWPFFCVLETPEPNTAVRIINSSAVEFPMVASVAPNGKWSPGQPGVRGNTTRWAGDFRDPYQSRGRTWRQLQDERRRGRRAGANSTYYDFNSSRIDPNSAYTAGYSGYNSSYSRSKGGSYYYDGPSSNIYDRRRYANARRSYNGAFMSKDAYYGHGENYYQGNSNQGIYYQGNYGRRRYNQDPYNRQYYNQARHGNYNYRYGQQSSKKYEEKMAKQRAEEATWREQQAKHEAQLAQKQAEEAAFAARAEETAAQAVAEELNKLNVDAAAARERAFLSAQAAQADAQKAFAAESKINAAAAANMGTVIGDSAFSSTRFNRMNSNPPGRTISRGTRSSRPNPQGLSQDRDWYQSQ